MRLRDEFAALLHDDLLKGTGERERDVLEALLGDLEATRSLTHEEALQVEAAAATLAAAMAEAAFIVGLEAGRDIRRLMCK